jgi:hypothetical protein
VLVIGAGAAGLMAALAARGALGDDGRRVEVEGGPSVVLVNNEERIGLKILVSGGGRCNVANARVSERDYNTDKAHILKGILRAFPIESVRAFFESRACPLYAEPLGKLFPQSDRARDILNVLLGALKDAGVPLIAPAEVTGLRPGSPWEVEFGERVVQADRVILATGGKSLPKTGSRGFGYEALAKLGHQIVPPLPALTPILCGDDGPLHGLSGQTVPAVLTLAPEPAQPEQLTGAKFKPLARAGGSLLVTHGGASGPCALDVSGACARALDDGEPVKLLGDFWSLTLDDSPWAEFRDLPKPPGASLPSDLVPRPPAFERFRQQAEALIESKEASAGRAFSARIPRALVENLLRSTGLDPSIPVKQFGKKHWRTAWLALTQADLKLTGVDGYHKAEVTSGGVKLAELARTTLESKLHPGLFVCGEVVNVTGRLGGFNFQWAWSSAFAAGRGAAAAS